MSVVGGEGGVSGDGCGATFDAPEDGYRASSLAHLEMLRGVSVFRGNLTIVEAVDLEPLGCLERIEGGLLLQSDLVGTLAGLGPLTEITLGLGLYQTALVDLSNFRSLESVRSLFIDANPSLASLWGLENLGPVQSSVTITNNGSLEDIAALKGIGSIPGDLTIENNPSLSSCRVQELIDTIDIGGAVMVSNNNEQTTCDGTVTCDRGEIVGDFSTVTDATIERFAGYTQITGDITLIGVKDLSPLACLTRIDGNAELWHLDTLDMTGLDALTEVTGSFGIASIVQSLHGLESLERVGMDFWLSGPIVLHLGGLESLVEVGGTLGLAIQWLENMEALSNVRHLGGLDLSSTSVQTLAGLENVVEIGGDLSSVYGHLNIQNNYDLRDLHALANLTHVSGDMTFYGNLALPACEAEWLVASVMAKGGVDGMVSITRNGSGVCE